MGLKLKQQTFKQHVGHLLRTHRQNQDLTLEQLAEESNLDANNISRIERGEHLPNFITVIKLIKPLQFDLRAHTDELIRLLKE